MTKAAYHLSRPSIITGSSTEWWKISENGELSPSVKSFFCLKENANAPAF
jgi:hypothetical protein